MWSPVSLRPMRSRASCRTASGIRPWLAGSALNQGVSSGQGLADIDRTRLPIETKTTGGKIGVTVAESRSPTMEPLRASQGAPNVVLVLPDDVGFEATGTFGGSIETPAKDGLAAEGVVLAAGGYFGGISLYIKEGRPQFRYNYFGSEYTTISGKEALPRGDVNLRYEFAYDGGGTGKDVVTVSIK